ncbi:uncharacterized protein LOC125233369 isoform X1 [Leguminivora glycinivorella]|uniref:uncharacterized protein LOC125233369 isoform X1 n=2 Tax=Leguminivora glycinivorella TaxID=1035111 RepID=UPI00200E10AC|nr:uncharacterized protein LOC125233369 isoform X1 [Leguminivora glycinivorella]
MSNLSGMSLADLVAGRGYVKAKISRTCNSVKITDSNEMLLNQKTRLLEAFKEYEDYNINILKLESNDTEPIEEYENKYLNALTIIDEEINRRNAHSPSTRPEQVVKLHQPIKLPPIDIPCFSGKFSEFIPFINLFNSLIDKNDALDSVQKLYYLRSHLKGEPLDIIKNLPLTNTSYNEALTILNERYNNKLKIINEHICVLLDLKPLVKSTSSSLREFVSSIKQQLAALANLEPSVKYWDAIILCVLSRKLDAYTARAYHMERDADTDPTMEGFLDYLERRALALENAEPGTSGQPRYLPANKTVLIATEKTLQCDLCIDTNGSSIPAIESPAGDWQRTGEECSSIAV